MFQREPGHAQQGTVQAQDCDERAHPCLELMDALAKDGHVLELQLAGNYRWDEKASLPETEYPVISKFKTGSRPNRRLAWDRVSQQTGGSR